MADQGARLLQALRNGCWPKADTDMHPRRIRDEIPEDETFSHDDDSKQIHAYPQCSKGHAICARSEDAEVQVCNCPEYQVFQRNVKSELNAIEEEISDTKFWLGKYKKTPFRPLRNAYGLLASAIGATNLLIVHTFLLSLALTMPILLIPPAIIAAYVYFRGDREENEILQHDATTFDDKKDKVIKAHQDYVTLRFNDYKNQIENKVENPKVKYLKLNSKYGDAKEKRRPYGNSFSHFIGGSVATLSILNAVLLPTVLLGILGGVASLGIATIPAVLVGCYFCYVRYNYLIAKKEFECNLNAITKRLDDTKDEIINAQRKIIEKPKCKPALEAAKSAGISLELQNTESKQHTVVVPKAAKKNLFDLTTSSVSYARLFGDSGNDSEHDESARLLRKPVRTGCSTTRRRGCSSIA